MSQSQVNAEWLSDRVNLLLGPGSCKVCRDPLTGIWFVQRSGLTRSFSFLSWRTFLKEVCVRFHRSFDVLIPSVGDVR